MDTYDDIASYENDTPVKIPLELRGKGHWASLCAQCGHRLVHAVSEHGAPLILDTTMVAIYILVPRFDKQGHPIAVPSRGYLVHACAGATVRGG